MYPSSTAAIALGRSCLGHPLSLAKEARLRILQKWQSSLSNSTSNKFFTSNDYFILKASYIALLSVAYQRMAWEALKKSINGIVNKV